MQHTLYMGKSSDMYMTTNVRTRLGTVENNLHSIHSLTESSCSNSTSSNSGTKVTSSNSAL